MLVPGAQHVSFWASQVVLVVKSPPANAGEVRDTGVRSLGWEDPQGEGSPPLQYSCLENPMDRGTQQATVHGVTELDMAEAFQHSIAYSFYGFPVAQTVKILPTVQETWVRSLGQEDLLEKEMATHSSILAWRIPWTEESGALQSMGSQRVRHDHATNITTTTASITMIIWASLVAQLVRNPLAMWEIWVRLVD